MIRQQTTRTGPGDVLRRVHELFTLTARIASRNQRACLSFPALRLGEGSTLLEPQEVSWLGWSALCATLPRRAACGLSRGAQARLRQVEHNGAMVSSSLVLLRAAAAERSLVCS